ncbi:MAG: phosphotransferase [Mycobacteriales bacterium]
MQLFEDPPPALGEPIAAGRTADIYPLPDGWVLRRYRTDVGNVEREAAAARLAVAGGVPTPEVREARGHDMVLRRVDGPTMVDAFASGAIGAEDGAQILADLHRACHAVRRPSGDASGLRDISEPGTPEDQKVLLHLDLHPLNVMLGADGPMLIDWANASWGPAGVDEAMTVLILSVVVLNNTLGIAEPARRMLSAFIDAAGDPRPCLEAAIAARRTYTHPSQEELRVLPEITNLARSLGPVPGRPAVT